MDAAGEPTRPEQPGPSPLAPGQVAAADADEIGRWRRQVETRGHRTGVPAGRWRSRPRGRTARAGPRGPDSTAVAGRRRRAPGPRYGGSRWRAARWRFSDARKSRRSLLARPATTIPRMPIARARVSVSASIREPTTRIVPASPTSSPPRADLAIGRRPRRGAARGSDRRGPRCPAGRPVARMTIAVPGRTLADDARDGASRSARSCRRWRPASGPASRRAARPSATRTPGPGIERDGIRRVAEAGRHAAARRSAHRPRRIHPARRAVDRRARADDQVQRAIDQTAGRDEAEIVRDRSEPRPGSPRGAPKPVDRCRRRRPVSASSCVAARPQGGLPGASRSRRRSARPGSRSGTSRRSTSRPPRPPATSTAKCLPRVPRRDRVAEPELGDRGLARRQVDELEAARGPARGR